MHRLRTMIIHPSGSVDNNIEIKKIMVISIIVWIHFCSNSDTSYLYSTHYYHHVVLIFAKHIQTVLASLSNVSCENQYRILQSHLETESLYLQVCGCDYS